MRYLPIYFYPGRHVFSFSFFKNTVNPNILHIFINPNIPCVLFAK